MRGENAQALGTPEWHITDLSFVLVSIVGWALGDLLSHSPRPGAAAYMDIKNLKKLCHARAVAHSNTGGSPASVSPPTSAPLEDATASETETISTTDWHTTTRRTLKEACCSLSRQRLRLCRCALIISMTNNSCCPLEMEDNRTMPWEFLSIRIYIYVYKHIYILSRPAIYIYMHKNAAV